MGTRWATLETTLEMQRLAESGMPLQEIAERFSRTVGRVKAVLRAERLPAAKPQLFDPRLRGCLFATEKRSVPASREKTP